MDRDSDNRSPTVYIYTCTLQTKVHANDILWSC